MTATTGLSNVLFPDDPTVGSLEGAAIDLEVTSVCDAVCGFCPREFMPDKKRFISMDVIERLADEVREHPILVITMCGIGESTLHPQLDQIVRTLADTGPKIEMTTHGGERLDARRFETLVQQGMQGFNFSLNATTPETHQKVMRLKDYDKTIANLQQILELKNRVYPNVTVHVSFVVCDINQHEVVDFVELWRPRGVTRIWLHPLNNRAGLLSPDVKPVDLSRFARMYEGDRQVVVDIFGLLHEEDNLCKIAKKVIFISADGLVRLCAMDYRRVTSYGHVLEHRLQDIHRGKLLTYLRGDLNDFCRTCEFCPSGVRNEPVRVFGLRQV